MILQNKNAAMRLTVLLLALSLPACASFSPAPLVVDSCPKIPPPTAELMEPEPSGTYSESVQQLLRTWVERLTGSKPSSPDSKKRPEPAQPSGGRAI